MKTEYLNNKDLEKHIAIFQQSKQDKAKYSLIIEDLKDAVARNNLGLSNVLEINIKAYKLADRDHEDAKNWLAISFLKLAENILRYRKFNFVDSDDAMQEFVMTCFNKIDGFDPKRGKAFNWSTTLSLNSYRQLYRTSRNYNELKKKFGNTLQEEMRKNNY